MNAIDLIKEDHDQFRGMIRDYEKARAGSDERGEIARQLLPRLDAHSRMEEEILYPALRATGDEQAQPRMAESNEEHAMQDALVSELLTLPPGTEQFEARFHVLTVSTLHHMEEEERETLPLAKRLLGDELDRLGAEMAARRDQVLMALRP